MKRDDEGTPLHAKVEQMLTEARVLLPGAQALLGFQMAVMLSTSFDKIPAVSKIIHSCSLCCIALTIILLMAPAAFHRISYAGEDSEEFHRLGSGFVIVAALPLAAGITGDLYVAIAKAAESPAIAAVWPTLRGEAIVLDLGASIGADAPHLVNLAVMGAAMAQVLFAHERPTVGLLNIGVEEIKVGVGRIPFRREP